MSTTTEKSAQDFPRVNALYGSRNHTEQVLPGALIRFEDFYDQMAERTLPVSARVCSQPHAIKIEFTIFPGDEERERGNLVTVSKPLSGAELCVEPAYVSYKGTMLDPEGVQALAQAMLLACRYAAKLDQQYPAGSEPWTRS